MGFAENKEDGVDKIMQHIVYQNYHNINSCLFGQIENNDMIFKKLIKK